MTVPTHPEGAAAIDERLAAIALAIDALGRERLEPAQRDERLLALLRGRDALEEELRRAAADHRLTAEQIARVVSVDQRIDELGGVVLRVKDFEEWRRIFRPDAGAWWWHPEVNDAHPRARQRRSELVWNTLSVVSLIATASAGATILQVFSVGSLGITEMLTTLGQVTGLAVLGRGVLTPDGHRMVKRVLARFSIPGHWYSEVIAALSVSLGLVSLWLAHAGLPQLFLEQGRRAYEQGNLRRAEEAYAQALKLKPDDVEANLGMGLVKESLDRPGEAERYYLTVVARGDARAMNNLARVKLLQLAPGDRPAGPDVPNRNAATIEAWLELGLQQAEANAQATEASFDLRYQLYRNIGWLQWWQRSYAEAEETLERAIALDESFTKHQLGTGMAHCLLGLTHAEQGRAAAAERELAICRRNARPETLPEYRWFFETNQDQLAHCVDLSAILESEEHGIEPPQKPFCDPAGDSGAGSP